MLLVIRILHIQSNKEMPLIYFSILAFIIGRLKYPQCEILCSKALNRKVTNLDVGSFLVSIIVNCFSPL
ncbi:unnamed protein product [Heterobilharzia americana]|nr:unnamed protein product [Heterobilharzia americana]